MPILKFFRDASGGMPFVSEELLSVMVFPHLDEQLEAARATFMLARVLDDVQSGPITIDAAALRLAIEGPGLPELRRRSSERVVKGCVAGAVLRGLIEMHERGDKPTVAACLRDVGQQLARYKTFSGADKAYGERSIATAWSEFKPVAHLWAVAGIAFERLCDSSDPIAHALGASDWLRLMNGSPRAVISASIGLLQRAHAIALLDGKKQLHLIEHMQPWLPPPDFLGER